MKKLIYLVGLLFIFIIAGCEHHEGTVKYGDCREIIQLKSDTWQIYYRQFVCDYVKRESGKIIRGTCVRVETEGGLFYSNGTCKTAYIYTFEKGPDNGCTKEYPYSGYNNKCYNDWREADLSKYLK